MRGNKESFDIIGRLPQRCTVSDRSSEETTIMIGSLNVGDLYLTNKSLIFWSSAIIIEEKDFKIIFKGRSHFIFVKKIKKGNNDNVDNIRVYSFDPLTKVGHHKLKWIKA